MVFWETTRACDLACTHCRASAQPLPDPRELSADEGKKLLRDVAALGTPVVVLTGGDPAKRSDLVELVRYGTELGLRMCLTPSATPLITAALLAALKQAGLARLAVSLDAAQRSVHDAFRGVHGSHARTFEILEEARRLGITTQINTSITRFNVDELPAIAREAERMQIELWSVFVVVPTGRAAADVALPPAQLETALEWLAALSETAPFDVKTTAAPQFRRILLTAKAKRSEIVGIKDGIGRAPRGVNDGQGILFVSHVGDISPSGFLPERCGNVRTDELALTYRAHPLFVALRDPDRLGGKCGRCEFRKVCGGSRARAFAATGDPLAEDPACPYQPHPRRPS